MSEEKFQEDMIALGHTVIKNKKFVIIEDDKKNVSGLDETGEPLEHNVNSVTYVSKDFKGKIFFDDDKVKIKDKLDKDQPDIEKV